MRRFISAAVAACAAAGILGASDGKIVWDKAEVALAKARAAGKPVLWYFVNDQFVKGATPPLLTSIATADQAFTHDSVVKRKDLFIWVRGDQQLANQFKIKGAPMAVITDPDGDVIHRAPFVDAEGLLTAMIAVLKEKFVNAPISWGSVVRTGPITKRLLVVGFDGPKGEGLKALEDKTLVKYHKQCEFVKLDGSKDPEAAKRWGVKELPAILICDAMEQVLERLQGPKSPAEVRSAILKSLKKLDDGGRSRR
jgi:hypothetical protein